MHDDEEMLPPLNLHGSSALVPENYRRSWGQSLNPATVSGSLGSFGGGIFKFSSQPQTLQAPSILVLFTFNQPDLLFIHVADIPRV